MTPVEILKAARAKIEKPENWIQGAMHRRKRSHDCYCALGALVFSDASRGYPAHAVGILSGVIHNSVSHWNDAPERTHADVIKAFDRAIELAGGQQ